MRMRNSDEEFIREALEEAEAGLLAGDVPIGALVVREGTVLARAHWSWERDRDLLAHPELVVLRGVDARGGTLYTTLEPCVMCMGAAMSSFLRRVVYSLDSPTDGAAGVPSLYRERLPASGQPWSVPEVVGGVCRAATLQLVERFLETARPGPIRCWAETLVDSGR